MLRKFRKWLASKLVTPLPPLGSTWVEKDHNPFDLDYNISYKTVRVVELRGRHVQYVHGEVIHGEWKKKRNHVGFEKYTTDHVDDFYSKYMHVARAIRLVQESNR